MGSSPPSILFVQTYYPQFLDDLYAREPVLAELPFDEQRRRLMATRFGVSDAFGTNLARLGWHTMDIVVNADRLQACWAGEHGVALTGNIHDQRRQILHAQVRHFRPDVLYVFEWSPLGDAFLHEIKKEVRLLIGQISSSLPANRTFAAYDQMISAWPPIAQYFRDEGKSAELLRLGFDDRVLQETDPSAPTFDLTFVGGLASVHAERERWLNGILRETSVDVFGYLSPEIPVSSVIRTHHRGSAWGLRMYEILMQSRVTLNYHGWIDVRGQVENNLANNMRLYEATGVGTCLLTDAKRNLHELFDVDREVVSFRSVQECAEHIRYLREHDRVRTEMARAGQRRTLREHTYAHRMTELDAILKRGLWESTAMRPTQSDVRRNLPFGEAADATCGPRGGDPHP